MERLGRPRGCNRAEARGWAGAGGKHGLTEMDRATAKALGATGKPSGAILRPPEGCKQRSEVITSAFWLQPMLAMGGMDGSEKRNQTLRDSLGFQGEPRQDQIRAQIRARDGPDEGAHPGTMRRDLPIEAMEKTEKNASEVSSKGPRLPGSPLMEVWGARHTHSRKRK